MQSNKKSDKCFCGWQSSPFYTIDLTGLFWNKVVSALLTNQDTSWNLHFVEVWKLYHLLYKEHF